MLGFELSKFFYILVSSINLGWFVVVGSWKIIVMYFFAKFLNLEHKQRCTSITQEMSNGIKEESGLFKTVIFCNERWFRISKPRPNRSNKRREMLQDKKKHHKVGHLLKISPITCPCFIAISALFWIYCHTK